MSSLKIPAASKMKTDLIETGREFLQVLCSICVLLFMLKGTLVGVLALFYLKYVNDTESPLFDLITRAGHVYHALGKNTIVYYVITGLMIAAPMIFRIPNLLEPEPPRRTGVLVYLQEPDLERLQVAKRVSQCVRMVEDSSTTHRRLLIQQESLIGSRDRTRRFGGLDFRPRPVGEDAQTKRRAGEVPGNLKVSSGRGAAHRFRQSGRGGQEVRLLWLQYDHLTHLRMNNSTIYPANRDERTRELLLRAITYAYCAVSLGQWVAHSVSQLCANSFFAMTYRVTGFTNFWGRFDIIVRQLIPLHVNDNYAIPLVNHTVHVLDQGIHLYAIRTKLELFRRSVHFLLVSGKSMTLTEDIRLLYDKEALEIHLCLRILMHEVSIMLKNIKSSVEGLFLVTFCTALGSVHILRELEFPRSIHLILLGVLIVALNAPLVPFAVFSEMCARTINSTWTLVATLEGFALSDVDERPDNRLPRGVSGAGSGSRLITMHTSHLWTSLIKDSRLIYEKVSLRIFGVAPLNYATLISINAWLFTMAVVVVTLQRDRI